MEYVVGPLSSVLHNRSIIIIILLLEGRPQTPDGEHEKNPLLLEGGAQRRSLFLSLSLLLLVLLF